MQPYIMMPPGFPLDWTVVAVITPRGPTEGGRRKGRNSLLSPTPTHVPAHPAAPLLRGFRHPQEPPRRRISTHETHSRPCTPTIVPWVTPLGAARPTLAPPVREPPKSRMSQPRVRISALGHDPCTYLWHIDPGGSRECVALPLRARLCGLWAAAHPLKQLEPRKGVR